MNEGMVCPRCHQGFGSTSTSCDHPSHNQNIAPRCHHCGGNDTLILESVLRANEGAFVQTHACRACGAMGVQAFEVDSPDPEHLHQSRRQRWPTN